MFSPYYARARRRSPDGAADPCDHCAFNVALYGRAGSRWAMTERGRTRLARDARTLRIGPSAMRWEGDTLTIDIDEFTVPFPTRLRGRVRVHAPVRVDRTIALAPHHRWRPIAPTARVEVAIDDARWSGRGYLDSNQGDEPLERAFVRWDWSRAHLRDGRSAVVYDLERRGDDRLRIGLEFDGRGGIDTVRWPESHALPNTGWGVSRRACSDVGTTATTLKTLTDAPFYARSLLDAQWLGERVEVMHESLSLARFDTAWVQAMLPFRMPRRSG